jgi:phosphoglycolate phosphatase
MAEQLIRSSAYGKTPVVLFDLDGTLADTIDDVVLAMNDALGSKGLPAIGREIVRANLGTGGTAIATAAVTHAGVKAASNLVAEIQSLYLESYLHCPVKHTRLYPGAIEVLARLSAQGIGVGLCTNKMTSLTKPLLRELQIDRAFDVIVCGDSLPRKKPAPDQIWHALSRFKGRAGTALLVGDTAICAAAIKMRARVNQGESAPGLG